jgi:hypothetical protein
MKLYTYWRSQASFRVRIALHLKGLVAETASLDLLKGDQFDPTYRTLNPEMVVPTLLDGDGPPLGNRLRSSNISRRNIRNHRFCQWTCAHGRMYAGSHRCWLWTRIPLSFHG